MRFPAEPFRIVAANQRYSETYSGLDKQAVVGLK